MVVVDPDGPLPGLVVLVDVDLGEERLVEEATGAVAGFEVGGVAVAGEVERVGQGRACLLVVGVGICELLLNSHELACDPILFDLQQVERDGAGVVSGEQLLALGGEVDALLLNLLPLVGCRRLEAVEVFEYQRLDVVPELGGEGDGAVLVLDQLLDELDRHGLALAVGGLAGAPGADQVGVLGSPAVPGGGDHQPRPAAAAVDAAAEVVLVGPLMGPGRVVCGQDVLDPLPGLGVDQGLVQSGVDDAPVANLALVVRVAEHPVQRHDRERLGRPLGGGPSRQPAGGELFEQSAEGGVPLGVAVEGPGDQVGTGRVDLDGAVDPAQLVGDVDVLVAERRPGDRAPEAGLLHQPLGDFVGEVAGVELGDAAHNSVHQHPRWRLVDVLAGADQGDPGLLEGEVDGDVVGSGPGQSVELVDDAVVHRVLAHVGEHALQLWSLGRGAGLSGVDELLDDGRVQRGCLAAVRLSLGGDGEAFLTSATGGLVGGRDPQVGDRRLGEERLPGARCRGGIGHAGLLIR